MYANKQPAHERITNSLIKLIEAGTIPWKKEWDASHAAGPIHRPLRWNMEPYRGVNVLMLWTEAHMKDRTAPIWMTYKQAQELGGQVQKGEKSSLVVFAKSIEKQNEDDETKNRFFVWRGYAVFNVEQIKGLPERFYERKVAPRISEKQRVKKLDAWIKSLGVKVEHGGNRAYYRHSTHHIQMPPFDSFESPDTYYATLFHELLHWTMKGTERKVDRGMEELVAEVGSALLCADMNVADLRERHASYLSSWLTTMKSDSRAILRAASMADRAIDYLNSLKPAKPAKPAKLKLVA